MIGFADHLVEVALKRALAYINSTASPATTLASILPVTLANLRTEVATRLIATGVDVVNAYRLTFRDGIKPTLAIVLEGIGAPDIATFGFDHTIDPDTGVQHGYLPSVATVRIFIYAQTRLEVRALQHLVRSTMLSLGDWLMEDEGSGGVVDAFRIGPVADLIPDKDMIPEGVSVYATSMTVMMSAVEQIRYLMPYAGTVGEFLSLAEYPRTVDAEPDMDTRTFVGYGESVEGGATPEE